MVKNHLPVFENIHFIPAGWDLDAVDNAVVNLSWQPTKNVVASLQFLTRRANLMEVYK
jgi:hypothetical protein